MRVVVTGGSGFIGQNLIKLLLSKGHEVASIDVNPLSLEHPRLVKSNMNLVNKVLFDGDCVVHLAGLGSIPRSLAQPYTVYQNNVMSFLSVLETCRLVGIPKVIYASSSSVYGKRDGHSRITEGFPIFPESIYAESKVTNERLAQQYSKHYGIDCVGLRFFNVYGPGQRSDVEYPAVIPTFVKAIRENKPIKIYNKGMQTRSFLYVHDLCDAIEILLNQTTREKIFNVAGLETISIADLLGIIGKVLGVGALNVEYCEGREFETLFSKADITRIMTELNWFPSTSVDAGVRAYCGL